MTIKQLSTIAFDHLPAALYDPDAPPTRDVPLWCLRVATEAELATAAAAVAEVVA